MAVVLGPPAIAPEGIKGEAPPLSVIVALAASDCVEHSLKIPRLPSALAAPPVPPSEPCAAAVEVPAPDVPASATAVDDKEGAQSAGTPAGVLLPSLSALRSAGGACGEAASRETTFRTSRLITVVSCGWV